MMLESVRQRYEAARAADAPELEQGKLRLVITPAAILYFLVVFLWDGVVTDAELAVVAMGAAALGVVVALFAWMLLAPGVNPLRRVAGAVYDMGFISATMIAAGEPATVLVALYLWVPIGNGFRYGRWYLHCAQALALAGFALVLWLSDFWRQHPMMGAAIVVTLLAVPWYVSLLVARLQAASSRLQEARREAEAANIA